MNSNDAADDKNSEELSNLLDSALEGFDQKKNSTDDDLDDFMDKFDREASQKAAKKFQEMMENMIRTSINETQSSPQQNNETPCSSTAGENVAKNLFSDLLKNTNEFVNANKDEKEFEKILEKLDSDSSVDDLMKFIIQTATSKEAVYPSIKDLHDKYGPFLEESKETLENGDYVRYVEQYRILGLLKKEYEHENQGQTIDIELENGRATRIANLWEDMQNYGLPPSELTPSAFSELEAGGSDDKSEGCCIM